MKSVRPRKPTIALNLPLEVAELLVYVRHVIEMMGKNAATFPKPNPPLADVSQHADDLDDAEVFAKSRAKSAVQTRNDKRRIVEDDSLLLKTYVYSIAAQNPAQAETIIRSAGMSPKQASVYSKPELQALPGLLPLEVILRGRAEKKKAFYEWQSSNDGGLTWTSAGTTNNADTTVSDLVAGTTYRFRYRATVKNVANNWSQEVSITVR